jgi:hypothetical protein
MERFAQVARVRERQTTRLDELAFLGHLFVFELATSWLLVPTTARLN